MKTSLLPVFFLVAIGGVQCGFPFFGFKSASKNFETLPSHKNYPLMARYIVHNSNWTSVAYKSYEKATLNLSLSVLFSMADGPMSNGTGVPYFYLTELNAAVRNLVRNDSRCGLMMSLVQTGICEKNKWDPMDPRCARVYLTGRIQRLDNTTAEHEFAEKSFMGRHPYLRGMPANHKFFFTKYLLESVRIISGFGGVKVVPLKEYFGVKDSKFNLYPLTY